MLKPITSLRHVLNAVARLFGKNQPRPSAPACEEPNLTGLERTLKLAEAGNAFAQNDVGFAYSTGGRVDQDKRLALYWLGQAAAQGLGMAQYNLAVCMLDMGHDDRKAVYWFRRAAEQGDPHAWFSLGTCYFNGFGVRRNEEQAAACFEAAAELGLPEAQLQLGACFQKGVGVNRDSVAAERWYRKAQRGGNAQATGQLAQLLDEREAWKANDED